MGKEGAFILQLLAQLQGNNLSNEQVFTTVTNQFIIQNKI